MGSIHQLIDRGYKLFILFSTITLLCLGACAPKHSTYSEFRKIDTTQGWQKNTPCNFTIQYPDSTASNYNLTLTIRHDNFYPYRNLWVYIDYIKDTHLVERDKIECTLSDDYGRWSSKGFGSSYEYTKTLKPIVNDKEYSHIVIWQGMKNDTITHILDIGITLTPNI